MAATDVSTNSERKYQCKFCPKSFTRSSVLTDHIRVHTGEKPFQCKTCLRSFSQLANLNRHQKIHIKDQTFKCKYCDERFSQLAHLLKHESTHKIQRIRDYPQDSPLTYPVISLRNQNAVSSSLDANSNQNEHIRTSVQSSSKNLTSFANFLQIPSSNFKENDILTSDQALSLDTDDFQQQIQMGFVNNPQNIDGKTSETFFHNSNNTIVVSEESEESVSFDQQISRNSSEVQPSRIKLELSTNSVKYFDNPLERKNSSFDIDLRAASDELKVIDIKPDLSVLSSTNNRNSINTVDHLNVALQLSTSSQDNFADSEKRNYNDIFANEPVSTENIQYFKSESELCFDNDNLAQDVQATTNDFIQDSASGLKSFNNSQLNLSLPTASSSFHFENSRVYIDSLNSQNEEMKRNSSNVDFEQLNISHSLSSGKFEVDEDETLVIRKQIKTDMSHLDCKDDEDNDDDIKFEFQSVSLASHKVQRKLEDEQMNQKENSFEQEKNRVLYLDNKVRMAQNGHIESNDKLCRDLESGDIILLSPGSVLQSTSKANNPLSHSVDNVDKPSISCNFEDANNQDVVITNCESSLEKSLEEVIRHESQFDRCGKIAVRDVSENPSIVIESVFSMNNKVKHGSSVREELCENSLLSSTVVKHSGISDKKKLRNEVEVINLEDFSPKEMRNDEQHNWSIPLVDIEEITPQKLDAESDFKIQLAETEDDTSKESNLASSKIWDINYLKTDSEETVLEEIPSFQNITNNNAKNISNHIVSLERSSCITCSWCNEKFSNKSNLLSHLCARSESFHSSKSPISEEVDQNPFKPCGQFPEEACETAENCANLTGSHQNQREKFICKYCKKHFSQASILLKHIETHTGKKAFVCDLCQQPFSQLTNLNPVKKKFQFRNKMLHCQFCQKTFPHSFQLLNHLKCHARSIQRSINILEDKIRQKRRGKVVLKNSKKMNMKSLKLRKSTSQKYLKMKPKSIQLSKKNVNQANSSNCLIPVVHLKRSHSDPEFNEISQENDENLNAQDVCNEKMKKQLFSQQCFNSVEVSGNLTRDTSSFVEKTNANISRTYTQEEEEVEAIEDVNQIVFPFSVKTSEDQDKVTTDSGFGPEQFRSENNSLHILENSQSEEADKSIQNVLVPILPSELVSNIEYIKSLPQKDMLPIPSSSSSSVLQKSYPRDHTSNPDKTLLEIDLGSMQSGFDSTNMPTRVNFHNTSGDENLSEVVFVTSNSADQISSSNAPVKSGQFHCKICNKSFNRKCILIKHLRTHTGEKPYKCDFCPRLFSQLHNLNRHRKTHLPFGLFPCKFCPTKYRTISELNAHNKKMHIGMKPYICKFCNKTFSRSSVLREHIRTHTGEKPFVCELCNRAFSQATNLNRHMKVHVPGRVFHCRYCSNTFKQYWHFKRHLITHIQLGKTSNEDAFIRKARRQHCIQQIHSRRTKPSKSNDFICKLSDSKEYRIARRIQSFEDKIESLGSKRDSLQLTASYEPATIPDILKANSFQDSSDSQPYEGTVPIITGTPEILAINGHLVPTSSNNSPLMPLEMQSVATPTGLVPNFCHESFQQKLSNASLEHGDEFLQNKVSSNYPLLLTTGENQMTSNKSSSSFGLENNSESFTKHKVSVRVNNEGNDNNGVFINSDCKFLREADDVNDKNQSKEIHSSTIELTQNYENDRVGILWRADHENQSKTNSVNKNLLSDNYEMIEESLENEDATTLGNPVNVKLEPEDVDIEKQSESIPENSNSDSLCRQNVSAVSFKKYPCRYCNKLFHHSQVLYRHLRSQHKSEMMMTSTCQLCNASFPDSDTLNKHRKTCSQLLLPYFCNLCKEKFPNSSELGQHRQRKHSGGVKRYSCCYCTKVFARNSVLTEHIRTHTGEKPFVCDVCQRPFSQATNLKRHQKIHARNGSFVCKYCKASFSQLSLFSRHLRTHVEENKHQESARHQLGNQASFPFLKKSEKFSKSIKISDRKKMRSKTRLFSTKDSAIDSGKSIETLTNNDLNKSFKNPLSSISQQSEGENQNYEIENITEEIVPEGNKTQENSEQVNLQEQLKTSVVSSDSGWPSFNQMLQFEQIDISMDGPGLCYSPLRRDEEKKTRVNQDDDLLVNVVEQGVVSSNVPIISPQTHFSDTLSSNFVEQQKGKDCLELSNQSLIDINLSIVKREENQSDNSSFRSSDQTNFQSYDTSNIFNQQISIPQTPDLKPITPNIEMHGFTPDFIPPAEIRQDSGINKSFQCQKCSLAFATQEQFNNHISTHSEAIVKTSTYKTNLSYTCKFCKMRFSTSRHLFHHQKLKHPQIKSHQCKYCGRFFARTTVLTEHIRTHTGEKPFVCNVCNRAFSQMTNLKRHQKIHDRKSITCRYCKAVFTDYSLLLKHMMQSHGKSHERILKNFRSDGPASSDIYAKISQRIKNMAPKSGRVNLGNGRSTRQNQNKSCLSNRKPLFVIDQQDEQIFSLGSSTHSTSLSNVDSGSSSNYFHLQNLQEDKIHNNISVASHPNKILSSEISTWPWKTNISNKAKSIPKSVNRNFREQTVWPNPLASGRGEQQEDQRQDIDLCIIPEISVSKLNRLAEFSPNISQSSSSSNTKKYSCRQCKKIFLQINDLHTHLPCYGGEKRYKCKYCSRTFSRSSVLQQHIRIHTGEKPFKCNQCFRCFTQSTNLKRHMKLHSADNPILKTIDSKKKSHLRTFSHSFHKQMRYYNTSKFRKSNRKSIPSRQFEANTQNHYEGESGRKNIFPPPPPPFSNLINPSTSSELAIIAPPSSHSNSLQTSSKEFRHINSATTIYDTTLIAPELNSLKKNSNTDDSLIVLSSPRCKQMDTIYVQINEENPTKIPLQPTSPTKTTDPNFIISVSETINHSKNMSFSIDTKIATNKEPVPSDHYGSNNYNQAMKNPQVEVSNPMREHKKPGKGIHVCKICMQVFANRWKLSAHLKSHSKRLFQCTFCEKGFTRSSVLREHIRTHTGEKPFKCIHCQRSFSQMTNLKRHLKLHIRQP